MADREFSEFHHICMRCRFRWPVIPFIRVDRAGTKYRTKSLNGHRCPACDHDFVEEIIGPVPAKIADGETKEKEVAHGKG